MITGFEGSLFTSFTPLVFITCSIAMVVLRAGASAIIFDIVGTFQAKRLITDAKIATTAFQSLMLDALARIQETGQLLGQQFDNVVNSTVPIALEIENARIEFEKFLAEGENVKQVEEAIVSLGLHYGYAADEAYAAAAKMAQLSGILGPGSTEFGTKAGLQFALISGMRTDEAMQRMINLQQQTGFMTEGTEDLTDATERLIRMEENTIKVFDQLNTIENRSAATMERMTFVMNQFAAQAELVGDSIVVMASMSAVLIESGEEQGKAGRALRTIYARMSGNIGGAEDAFHELGIATRDAQGEMRAFGDIMTDLEMIYDSLNGVQKQNLAQAVAGTDHYARFIKLSENYDRALQLQAEGILGISSAEDELTRKLESNAHAYDVAQDRLKNYTAEVGDALVPALTESTNLMADMNREFAAVLNAPILGYVTKKVFAMGQVFKDVAGPMMETYLNIQQLNIAYGTQQAVLKSLRGEDSIRQDAYGNASENYISLSSKLEHYNSLLAEEERLLFNENFAFEKLNATQLEGLDIKNKELIIDNRRMESFIAQNKYHIDTINNEIKENDAIRQRSKLYRNLEAAKKAAEDPKYQPRNRVGGKFAAGSVKTDEIKELNDEMKKLYTNTQAATVADKNATAATIKLIEERGKLLERIGELTTEIEENTFAIDKNLDARARSAGKVAADRAVALQTEIDDMAVATSNLNAYTMQLGMAGTAITMFGWSQRHLRAGMALNTAAMVLHMKQQYMSIKASQLEMEAKHGVTAAKLKDLWATTRATISEIWSNRTKMTSVGVTGKQAVVTTMLGNANTYLAGTAAAARVAITGLMTAAWPMLAIAAGAYVLVTVLEKIGFFASKAADAFSAQEEAANRAVIDQAAAIKQARQGAVDFASTTEMIMDLEKEKLSYERSSLSLSQEKAKELDKQLDTLKDMQVIYSTLEVGEGIDFEKQKKQREGQSYTDMGLWKYSTPGQIYSWFAEAPDILHNQKKRREEIKSQEQLLNNYFDMLGEMRSDREDWEERTYGILDADGWGTDQLMRIQESQFDDWIEKWRKEYPELISLLETEQVSNWDELAKTLENNTALTDTWTLQEKIAWGLVEDSYNSAAASLYEFSNAREELFYGFSTDRLTGDLVRQVQQQGVETLITTTEVIMTNNFNGMTTSQVANQILDEIERGAGIRNYNLHN